MNVNLRLPHFQALGLSIPMGLPRAARFLLAFIISLVFLLPALAQEDSTEVFEEDTETESPLVKSYFDEYDSSAIALRSFDTARLNAFRKDPQFHYIYSTATMTLWDRFWEYFAEAISDLFSVTGETHWFRFYVYVFFLIILVYTIVRLLRMDALKIFYGAQEEKKDIRLVIEENIHEMDFEALTHEAVQRQDYRAAVRMFFLWGLKLMSDKQYVTWEPGKTSREYIHEIKEGELKEDFKQLNYYFEYSWYGNFTLDQALFNNVQRLFNGWKTKL